MQRIKNYQIIKKIGRGSYGDVFKARNAEDRIVAIKEIRSRDPDIEKYIQGEISVIEEKLKHPNIVKVLDYFTDNTLYIAMEFCNLGDLSDHVLSKTPDLSERMSYMVDMARGVNYLHAQRKVHRDLKPENILLTDQTGKTVCKIADFGVSRVKLTKHDRFSTYIGSYAYMAPEITGDQEYSHEVDTFALGLLFFAVYKLTVLTNSFNQKSLIPGIYVDGSKITFLNEELKKNMPCEGRFVTSYFGDDPNIGKLVYSMLHQEPERRPEMEQVLVQMVEINVEQRYKSMTTRQESLQQELDEVRAQKNDLQVQNSSLRGELNVVKAKKSDLQVQNTSLGGKVNVVEIQKNDLQVQICSLRDELNRLTAEKNELQIEVEQWRKSASQVVFLFFVFISIREVIPDTKSTTN